MFRIHHCVAKFKKPYHIKIEKGGVNYIMIKIIFVVGTQ
jgi:hypothetical protein